MYSSESEAALRWITAVDIALMPDMTLIRHTIALNARLNESSNVHSLDSAYHLRLTTLQCYVNTAALLEVYSLTDVVLRTANAAAWELTAIGYEAVEQEDGAAVLRLLVRPDEAWVHMQHQLIFALVPHFDFPGTEESVESVAAYIPNETGLSFKPHFDVGGGSAAAVREIASAPFTPFAFRPTGAAIYLLGNDVPAHVRLKWWAFPSESANLKPATSGRAPKRSRAQQGAQTFRRRYHLLGP